MHVCPGLQTADRLPWKSCHASTAHLDSGWVVFARHLSLTGHSYQGNHRIKYPKSLNYIIHNVIVMSCANSHHKISITERLSYLSRARERATSFYEITSAEPDALFTISSRLDLFLFEMGRFARESGRSRLKSLKAQELYLSFFKELVDTKALIRYQLAMLNYQFDLDDLREKASQIQVRYERLGRAALSPKYKAVFLKACAAAKKFESDFRKMISPFGLDKTLEEHFQVIKSIPLFGFFIYLLLCRS